MDIRAIQPIIVSYLRQYGVTKADLFGSVARGDETDTSDIDLLIQLPHKASLFDYIGLKQDLEQALGRSVDLVEYDAIKPRLKSYIMRDIKPIDL